jgi:hypothetical protein
MIYCCIIYHGFVYSRREIEGQRVREGERQIEREREMRKKNKEK